MSVFKCKMCGGTIEFEQGATVGVCDSCGTKQTLPRLDDDRKANLYDRANHFRRNNDFDKAMSIYEQILNEDNTDAEAYWSLVLCRYGIEYVEDPLRINASPPSTVRSLPRFLRTRTTNQPCNTRTVIKKPSTRTKPKPSTKFRRASLRFHKKKSRLTCLSATRRPMPTVAARRIPCLQTTCTTS